ncbi:MAG: flagellar biosynthesis anti-sigma factor FlgM [Bdellovibrionales bacterium]
MKITPKATNGTYSAENASQSAKSTKTKVDGKAANPLADLGSSAKVDISSRSQDIKKSFDIAKKAPDVDEAKVAKYQGLIDSGKYKVDSAKVADKMVDEMLLNEYGSEE